MTSPKILAPSVINLSAALQQPSIKSLFSSDKDTHLNSTEKKTTPQLIDSTPESALLPVGDPPNYMDLPFTSSNSNAKATTSVNLNQGALFGVPQSSTALQDDLAQQLVRMAGQLKSNAELFSSALSEDRAVVAEAETKLEENYDSVTKERVRVRDVGQKSKGTTWLTIISILVVIIAFFLTFLVIRMT